MGLLNFFKKSTPQPNTNTRKVNLTNVTYSGSFSYVHKYDVLPNDPGIFVEYENGKVVSQLRFHIQDNELKIRDFVAGGMDESYHHGTQLFIALLQYIGHPIVRIYGELSAVDALNNNWNRSISFYVNLPKHVFSSTGLNYKFYLYDDAMCKNDVTHLVTTGDIKANIEKYRNDHLYDEEGNSKNRSGSFLYILQ